MYQISSILADARLCICLVSVDSPPQEACGRFSAKLNKRRPHHPHYDGALELKDDLDFDQRAIIVLQVRLAYSLLECGCCFESALTCTFNVE